MIKLKHIHIIFYLLLFCNSYSQELQPTKTMALLRGVVTNFKNKPLSKEIVLLVDSKTKKSYTVNTESNGKFQVLIPVGATYSLKYKNFTTDVDYTKMVVPADPDATYEVQIKIEPPKEFVLDNVYFDTGKATLKPSSHKALNDLVEILKIKNTMVVEIQGHTDNVGKPEDNMSLSQLRADAVRAYLVSKGIDEKRITSKGYGDLMPVAENTTETNKAKNRRTSLKVVKE